MELKQAINGEEQTVLSILKETAKWLEEIGSDQWSDILKGQDNHGLTNAIKKGEVFFFYNNNQLVGMVAAWRTPTLWDKLLWEKYGLNQDVCYLHRIIIRPAYRKNGYGKELLNALKAKFKEEVSELRLDCLASNDKLVQFYRRNKFENIGSSKDSNGTKFELFLCPL